jgi:hypothetical protein
MKFLLLLFGVPDYIPPKKIRMVMGNTDTIKEKIIQA